jgi:hypothetical protein
VGCLCIFLVLSKMCQLVYNCWCVSSFFVPTFHPLQWVRGPKRRDIVRATLLF